MLQINFTPTTRGTRGSAMPREMTEWSMWQFNGMPRPGARRGVSRSLELHWVSASQSNKWRKFVRTFEPKY
jgi:hypothetical protein